MEDNIIYIERYKVGQLKIKDLSAGYEYHPCDEVKDDGVYISEYDYYLETKNDIISACIEESVTTKHWDHDYISPRLYIKSIAKAAEKNSKVDKVIGVDFDQGIMRVVYSAIASEAEFVEDVIKEFDKLIDEIRAESEVISKRELLKYINS